MLTQWVEGEFLQSARMLEGAALTPQESAELLEALRVLHGFVESEGGNASLTPELLLRLHKPSGGAELRKNAGDPKGLNK
ncbi:MAG TPA: hypothetical protein VNO70_03205, partial [Blastocatellia bacterium]|nr:hypothetical protein [Blastocatellia bacterium]